MKKLKLFIKNLSLSQQVFALIFFFTTFFASFFFIYISGNVDTLIRRQIFDTLDRTQSTLIYAVNAGVSFEDLITDEVVDDSINHLFYDNKNFYTHDKNFFNDKPELLDEIVVKIDILKRSHKENEYHNVGPNETYYYLRELKSGDYIISIADYSYVTEFKESLLGSVVNVTVLVVGTFFIILMIWVAWIIHPLNLLKQYIIKFKNGEDPKIVINRNDEVGQLAFAITAMRNELEKQEKTKEEMIHNISHDLKTPIATIKSYAESINDGIYPYGTLDKSVNVIIDNAERLEKKVHSLLYLNRVEYLISQSSGNDSTNMTQLVNEIVVANVLINPNIEIITKLDDNVIFKGDDEPWRVAIENLLENALRYAATVIEIELKNDYLSVYNDGSCMSEERIASLFKPFEKGREGKFGLGLSIVFKVVNAYGYVATGENMHKGVIFRIEG